ncbi:hypothetical protein C8F01DRAFT_229276 [Mycena amicta]|nr:hypothetical protein C8F01DRAFT_229276 [Mycena amicta]
MVSFAQFLENAGIHMAPGLFIAIIAGGILFVLILIGVIVYVHGRNKRKMQAFDKPAISVLSLAQPRPPLPLFRDSDPEAQRSEFVGREVIQQEATYQQLIRDLQRPSGTPTLPNQTPRDHSNLGHSNLGRPSMKQHEPLHIPLPPTAYPVVATPPPVATALIPPADKTSQLKRGQSVRSLDSASVYSIASAPPDAHEPAYQGFTMPLPSIPASPSTPITPKWPSSPGPYVWPKRQRASLIREELAPETYAKVRWRTDSESADAVGSIPVAQALPSTPTAPQGLRINIPPAADWTPVSAAFHRSPPAPRTQRPF